HDGAVLRRDLPRFAQVVDQSSRGGGLDSAGPLWGRRRDRRRRRPNDPTEPRPLGSDHWPQLNEALRTKTTVFSLATPGTPRFPVAPSQSRLCLELTGE